MPDDLRLEVLAAWDEAQGVRAFHLGSTDGGTLPPWEPGAHVTVQLPGGVSRDYSLCGDPDRPDRWEIAVLREANGTGSSTLHDSVAVGDRLTVSPPRNDFPLDPGARRYVLIAGGIGITPILSMARALVRREADFNLYYCTRAPERTAYRDLLSGPPFQGHVRFVFDHGDPAANGLDVEALLARHEPGTQVYCCGPQPLMAAVRQAARHWPQGAVRFESFATAPAGTSVPGSTGTDAAGEAPAAGADSGLTVEIASSGQLLEVPPDRSILEVLEDHGIAVDSQCREGYCGTCITGVLEGEPDHRDVILSAEEHAENRLMTVCCSRARGDRLVLDL